MKYLGQVIYDQIARFRGGQLYISDNSDPGDYFSIVTGAAGATTISTVDGGVSNGTSADLTMNIDGEMATTVSNYWRLTSTGPIAEIDVTASYPQLKLTSTVNNNFNSGNIVFEKDRDDNSSVDNQELGSIYYYGRDASANDLEIFADIQGKISENTHGDEAGKIELNVMADGNGGVNTRAGVTVEGASDADVANVMLGYGATSTTTINGGISIGGHTVNDIDIAGEFVDSDEHLMTSAAIDDRINAAAGGGLSFDGSTANGLLTYKDADEITVESNATYDGADLTFTSATSTKPILSIENTTHDANAGELRLVGRRSADASVIAAIGDDAGTISFVGENAKSGPDPETITYGRVVSESSVVTDGGEMGKMTMSVGHNGSAIGGSLGFLDFMSSTASVMGETTTYGSGSLLSMTSFNSTITDFQSTVSTAPIMTIRNYTNDATGPSMTFQNSRGGSSLNVSNVNGDDLGTIKFTGFDSNAPSAAGITTTFAQILGETESITNTDEAGKLSLTVATSDGSTSALQNAFTATGQATHNYISTTIGYGTASTTTIAGDLQVAGGDILGPTDGDLNIKSDGGVFFTLDTDTDENNQEFTIAETGGSGDFRYNAGRGALDIYSTNSGYPTFGLTCKSDDPFPATSTFIKERTDTSIQVGEDDDIIGLTRYVSYNDAGTPEAIYYASVQGSIADASDSDEAGKYEIKVATSDGSTSAVQNAFSAVGSPSANDVDVTLGHGSTSTTTVPGKLVVGTRIDFDSTGITGIQTASESFSDDDVSLMTSAAIDDRINAAGGGGSSLIHVDMPKYISIYLFYVFTKDYWYTAPMYTTHITSDATIDGATLSASYQARAASYIANSACKVKKVTLVFQMSSTALSGDIDLEWALVKWTPQDDTNNTAAMTEMTITNHDGAFTETDVHTLTFTVTDNAASTLAAKDCIAFCVRSVDTQSSTPRMIVYGHGNFEIELT